MSKYRPNFDQGCFEQVTCAFEQNVLVIGDLSFWQDQGRTLPESQSRRFIELADLTAKLITEFAPEIVMSPLVGLSFDVMDVAHKLKKLRFLGRYLAVCDTLPDALGVCRELRECVPDIDLQIVEWQAFRRVIEVA